MVTEWKLKNNLNTEVLDPWLKKYFLQKRQYNTKINTNHICE